MNSITAAMALLILGMSASISDRRSIQDLESVRSRIGNGDLHGAAEQLDALSRVNIEDHQISALRNEIISGFVRAGNHRSAVEQTQKLLEFQIATLDKPATQAQVLSILVTVQLVRSYFPRADKGDAIEETIDRVIVALEEHVDKDFVMPGLFGLVVARNHKAEFLARTGHKDTGIEILKRDLSLVNEVYQARPDDFEAAALKSRALSNLLLWMTDRNERTKLFSEHQALTMRHVNQDPLKATMYYLAAASREIHWFADVDAHRAETILHETQATIDWVVETYPTTAESLNGLMEDLFEDTATPLKLGKMIGQPAPEFDSLCWINGEPMTLADLEGNVVLLDFWAVWCGPCITMFPRLKDWHEQYSDRGLQIIGVTQYFDYTWDEATQRAIKSQVEVSSEDENAMLIEFLNFYDLPYPISVSPTDGAFSYDDYGVTGIPHAVLIDKRGLVRLVKIGDGEDNAVAIEEMILKLLEEE